MTAYITYNEKKGIFQATGNRPSNQNHPEILQKIANRLTQYVYDNRNIDLTDLQVKFINCVNQMKKGDRFLGKEGIDIAHHIAISRIIKVFVILMNKQKAADVRNFKKFGDAILSTESPGDDKGRTTLADLLDDIKNGDEDPETLCDRANNFIARLNCSTRNLIPGHKSVNRSIGENKDLHFMAEKGKPGSYQETAPSKRLSYFFSSLPSGNEYAPKSKRTRKGEVVLSSSVDAKVEQSYVCVTPHSSYTRRL